MVVKDLPRSIERDSVRVEGRGKATICEVQYQQKHVAPDRAAVADREKALQEQLKQLKQQSEEVSSDRIPESYNRLCLMFKTALLTYLSLIRAEIVYHEYLQERI